MVGVAAMPAFLTSPVLPLALRASKVPVEGCRWERSSQGATLASTLVFQLLYNSLKYCILKGIIHSFLHSRVTV